MIKAALFAVSLGLGVPIQAADFNLAKLMYDLAQVERIEAEFQEQKTLAILDTPLEFSGTLSYRAPAYIKKQTTHAESFIIDGDWLTIETPEQGRRQYSLTGYRELQPLSAALRGLLSGDLTLLQRYYTLSLSGNTNAWMLELKPVAQTAAEFIEHIRVMGHANRIDHLQILETNGDHSSMTISPH